MFQTNILHKIINGYERDIEDREQRVIELDKQCSPPETTLCRCVRNTNEHIRNTIKNDFKRHYADVSGFFVVTDEEVFFFLYKMNIEENGLPVYEHDSRLNMSSRKRVESDTWTSIMTEFNEKTKI
jgi:hypothetical protein